MTDDLVQKQGGWDFVKANWKVMAGIGALVLIVVLGIFGRASFKQTIEMQKDQIGRLTTEKTDLLIKVSDSMSEVASLREQVSKERSKNKKITEWYENGNKKSETSEESSSSEARTTELALENNSLHQQNEDLRQEKHSLESELKLAYSKDTEKRGQFRMGVGFEPVNPSSFGLHLSSVDVLGPIGFWGFIGQKNLDFKQFQGIVGVDLGL